MKKYLFILLALCSQSAVFAQGGSLLDLLGEEEETEFTTNAFKSSRVINSQSMEMLQVGTLDFRILHRFGALNQGYKEFFGLDQASMRMGFDYGVLPNMSIGIGRSTSKKELDGFVKYRILWQSKGKRNMPLSLIWVSGMTYNGLPQPLSQPDVEVTFSRRLAYYHQLIIGRKFSDRLTLQLSPILVHRNIVDNILVPNDLFAVGFGGRCKLSQRLALVWDYSYLINRFPANLQSNPLSIGFDIETGGHVFQLHFSNAIGMNERAYLTDSNDNWLKGDIRFGFNLSRVFQVKKNKI
ncbi:MAG: hypothetical protein JNK77_20745 [Saprospiraceae bacterium]|nr:hypothetical protein [Saprospiraceae bacterium]